MTKQELRLSALEIAARLGGPEIVERAKSYYSFLENGNDLEEWEPDPGDFLSWLDRKTDKEKSLVMSVMLGMRPTTAEQEILKGFVLEWRGSR